MKMLIIQRRPRISHCYTVGFFPHCYIFKMFSFLSCSLIQFIWQIFTDNLVCVRHCLGTCFSSPLPFAPTFFYTFRSFPCPNWMSERQLRKRNCGDGVSMYIIFSAYSNNHFTDFLWFQNIVCFDWMNASECVWQNIAFVYTLGLRTSCWLAYLFPEW